MHGMVFRYSKRARTFFTKYVPSRSFWSHVTWNSAVPDPIVWCCILLFLYTLGTIQNILTVWSAEMTGRFRKHMLRSSKWAIWTMLTVFYGRVCVCAVVWSWKARWRRRRRWLRWRLRWWKRQRWLQWRWWGTLWWWRRRWRRWRLGLNRQAFVFWKSRCPCVSPGFDFRQGLLVMALFFFMLYSYPAPW